MGQSKDNILKWGLTSGDILLVITLMISTFFANMEQQLLYWSCSQNKN